MGSAHVNRNHLARPDKTEIFLNEPGCPCASSPLRFMDPLSPEFVLPSDGTVLIMHRHANYREM